MDATTLTPFGTISCAELMAMEFPPIAPEPPAVPTWAELIEVEPELAEVERMATKIQEQKQPNGGADRSW